MNEPTIETLAGRLDRVEREMERKRERQEGWLLGEGT